MDSKAIVQHIIEASAYAGIGVGVATATKILKPAGGDLFVAVAFLSGKVIAECLSKFFGNSSVEEVLKVAT